MNEPEPVRWLDPITNHEALPLWEREQVAGRFLDLMLPQFNRKDETLPPEHYLYGDRDSFGPFSVTASWTLIHNPKMYDNHPGRFPE